MRGASSHDGKISGNRQLVHAYDSDHGHKRGEGKPSSRGGESGGVHEESGHDEIKQVVAEHGPAHKHLITKHSGGGGFGSETTHEDGHVHRTEGDHHPDLDHAHEHGQIAMGEAEDTDMQPMNEDARRGAGRRAAAEEPAFMPEED